MIRSLLFFSLLSVSAICVAEPLYKWVEPDGSITFSVKPPPEGVEYETVNAEPKSSLSKADTDDRAAAEPAVSQSQLNQTQKTPLAPQIGVQSGIVRAPTDPSVSAPNSNESVQPQSASQLAVLEKNSRKQRQCEDLLKRVVSLEGRLKSRLTPEDMDNTVVHMARYQRSYDQHCVQ